MNVFDTIIQFITVWLPDNYSEAFRYYLGELIFVCVIFGLFLIPIFGIFFRKKNPMIFALLAIVVAISARYVIFDNGIRIIKDFETLPAINVVVQYPETTAAQTEASEPEETSAAPESTSPTEPDPTPEADTTAVPEAR